MHGQFGLETPQEALRRANQGFTEAFQTAQETGGPGAQLGASLAAIFGPSIRKRLETRNARKSEAAKLALEGISSSEARAMAKAAIPVQFDAVRKAKKIQNLGQESAAITEQKKGELGETFARIEGMFHMSRNLRAAGFNAEATALSLQAVELSTAEEQRVAALQNLKARTAASLATAAKSEAELRLEVGQPAFVQLVNQSESLRAQIEESDDVNEIESLERQLGKVEANIAAKNFRSRTEADLKREKLFTGTGVNLQATELFESQLLDDRLGSLEQDLIEAKGTFAATAAGRVTANFLGFLEDKFGREPDESETDFINRVTQIDAGAAFVSAEIRHALTGAAMSAEEAVYLEPFLAGPMDSVTEKLAKIRVIRQFTQMDIASRTALLNDRLAGKIFFIEAERKANLDLRREKRERAEAVKTSKEGSIITQTASGAVIPNSDIITQA